MWIVCAAADTRAVNHFLRIFAYGIAPKRREANAVSDVNGTRYSDADRRAKAAWLHRSRSQRWLAGAEREWFENGWTAASNGQGRVRPQKQMAYNHRAAFMDGW